MSSTLGTDPIACPDCRGRRRLFAGSAVGYIRCPRCQPIQTTPITTTTNNPTTRSAPR
jgi:DNA-directed RNA polymerase subunit RPC12/RpoP